MSYDWGRGEVHIVLVGKPARRKPHERPRCIWENNIKKDLKDFI